MERIPSSSDFSAVIGGPVRDRNAGVGLLLLLIAAFAGLLGRLVYLHIHEGPRLAAYGRRHQTTSVPLPARRGAIVDRRGRILAGTQLRQSVFADPRVIPDKRQAARVVAEVLGRGASEIETDLVAAADRRFFVLARGITPAQARRIQAANIYGIGLFEEPYRVYPAGAVLGPVLGFVAADGHGVSGLEHQFETWLAGRPGFKTVVCDVRRRAVWLSGDGYEPGRNGLNVALTLDAVIQEHAESGLAEVIARYEAESGLVVVMRPGNGEILAMATSPGFEPEAYQDYPASRYRNRVLTDPVEPGSVFKPFVAAAALADEVVTLDEVFFCHNGLFVEGGRQLHDHHPYGDLTFQDILVKSSNIGMALVGQRLGNERMYGYLRRFGFGRRTGIDLSGEDAGLMAPLHRWTTYSTTSLPMGHEIAATPIQLARAFCAFANGGKLVRPRVVQSIVDAAGREVRRFDDSEPAPRILSESLAALVKDQLLIEVVRRGTGKAAGLDGYQVFGKTGTAQMAMRGGGGYEPGAYIASFVGGAPAYAPQVVVLVSVVRPNPAKGYYGGTVAAPLAGAILDHTLRYLNVPPERSPS